MSLISIVLCTYNGEDYIKEQIECILNQTYTNLELIISDDNSTDSTIGILKAYSEIDTRIRVNVNKETLGYIKNFEKGISMSRGDYIALSDQDDIWELDKIEKLHANIKNSALIYCDSSFVDENSKHTGKKISSNKNMLSTDNPLNLCLDNCVSGHALLFNTKLLNAILPFPERVPHDWWIAFTATFNGGITYLNETLVQYRIHNNNSLLLNRDRKSKENKILKKQVRIYEFYKKCPADNQAKKILLDINQVYKTQSVRNNIKKIALFIKYKRMLFPIKKKRGVALLFYILRQFNKLK